MKNNYRPILSDICSIDALVGPKINKTDLIKLASARIDGGRAKLEALYIDIPEFSPSNTVGVINGSDTEAMIRSKLDGQIFIELVEPIQEDAGTYTKIGFPTDDYIVVNVYRPNIWNGPTTEHPPCLMSEVVLFQTLRLFSVSIHSDHDLAERAFSDVVTNSFRHGYSIYCKDRTYAAAHIDGLLARGDFNNLSLSDSQIDGACILTYLTDNKAAKTLSVQVKNADRYIKDVLETIDESTKIIKTIISLQNQNR